MRNEKTTRKGKEMTKNKNYLSIMKGVYEAPIEQLLLGGYHPEEYNNGKYTRITQMCNKVLFRLNAKTVGDVINLKYEDLPKGFGKTIYECLQMTIDNFVSHRFNN